MHIQNTQDMVEYNHRRWAREKKNAKRYHQNTFLLHIELPISAAQHPLKQQRHLYIPQKEPPLVLQRVPFSAAATTSRAKILIAKVGSVRSTN